METALSPEAAVSAPEGPLHCTGDEQEEKRGQGRVDLLVVS